MKRLVVTSSLLSLLLAGTASASPIGPVFPPPGGLNPPTVVAGTNAGDPGGIRREYTGLNPIVGDYSALWFGVTDLFLPLFSNANGAGIQAVNTPPLIGGNTATWTGASPWNIQTSFGPVNATVQFVLSVFDTLNNPVGLGSFGLTGSEGAELAITGPLLASGFRANFAFLANGQALNTFFNTLPGTPNGCAGPCVNRSVNGAFWYEPNVHEAAVPEPASLALMGSGLLVAVRKLRRRRAE